MAYVVNGSETKTATPIIHSSALVGLPSQSAWFEPSFLTTPMWCRITLMTPTFGSRAHLKISAVIITEAAQGMISAHRVTRRPGNLWLNSWARPSEISTVTETTTTTQITVRTRTETKSGSLNSWRKLAVPL